MAIRQRRDDFVFALRLQSRDLRHTAYPMHSANFRFLRRAMRPPRFLKSRFERRSFTPPRARHMEMPPKSMHFRSVGWSTNLTEVCHTSVAEGLSKLQAV